MYTLYIERLYNKYIQYILKSIPPTFFEESRDNVFTEQPKLLLYNRKIYIKHSESE